MKILYLLVLVHATQDLTDEFEVIESQQQQTSNLRPIIGLVTQPLRFMSFLDPEKYSYLAESYVKFLESSGARVVPINYKSDWASVKETMDQLNGLMFAGGVTSLIKIEEETKAKRIIELEIAKKKTVMEKLKSNDFLNTKDQK